MSEGGLAHRIAVALRGPGHWHRRHFPPGYAAVLDDAGWSITLDGRTRRFPSLRDWRAPGGTVHILLSGPSVRTIVEPARLLRAPTITVNGSYRILTEAGVGPADLYLVSDVGFVRRQWDAFRAGVANAKAVALDHRVLIEVARRDPALIASTPVRVFDNLKRPYGRSDRWWRQPPPGVTCRGQEGAFSVDAGYGFHPSGTVAYLALQMAAAQRPARIVLFGLDLTGGPRFYAEKQAEQSMLMEDLESMILPDFRLAAGVLGAMGVTVLNASPDSALPDGVFPRVDPNAVLAT